MGAGYHEKTSMMILWIFYFLVFSSLVVTVSHYLMITMQAMVMEMLWNNYAMIIWTCCCCFIWLPVVVGWSVMVCSLYLKSLCLEISYTVEGSYSGGGYTGQSSYGGYSRDSAEGGSGRGYSGSGGGYGGERYTDDDSYGGYSVDDGYTHKEALVIVLIQVMIEVHMEEVEGYMMDKYMVKEHMLNGIINVKTYMTQQKMTFARSFKLNTYIQLFGMFLN